MRGAATVALFGGTSGERLVSVASAQNVTSVLTEAAPLFIAPDGSVHVCPREALAAHTRPFEIELRLAAMPAFESLTLALDAPTHRDDVFVLCLHGGAGEDGTVQREFERRGMAFTGSGSEASAAAFDKRIAKERVAAHGVRTAIATHLPATERETIAARLREAFTRHGTLVAKPVADGSSVGLFHLRDAREIDTVADRIARAGVEYIAEEFVAGTELTVGVIDVDGEHRALCASEVRLEPGRAFDYEGKYLGRGTVELTPAQVAPDIAASAMRVALIAHGALGCAGYSRTDVIVDARGPVFLEINTLPGLTRASFLPQQLAVAGVSMRAFLDAQIALAVKRRDRARHVASGHR